MRAQILINFNNIAEDSTSSTCGDCHSSKELVNVQIQSDDIDSSAMCSEESEKVELNEVISYEEIDHALATHIKRSINKIHEISTVLQGTTCKVSRVVSR